jgi:two-component system cell cycle sensor histidine kinase/response regulator CckA
MRKRVVLLVDDEPAIRSLVRAILQLEGLEIIEVGDGIDGFNIVQEFGQEISLVLTNVKIPRMDGISLAKSVRELFPRMPVLFISGCADPIGEPIQHSAFLRKPFRTEALVQAVRKLASAPTTEA